MCHLCIVTALRGCRYGFPEVVICNRCHFVNVPIDVTLCFWPLGDRYCESPLLMASSPQLDESWPAVIVCLYNSSPHSRTRWMRQSSFSGGFSMTASREHMHAQTHCIILFVYVCDFKMKAPVSVTHLLTSQA